MTPPVNTTAITGDRPSEIIASRTVRVILAILLASPAVLFISGPRPVIAALYFGAGAALLLIGNPRVCFFLFLAATSVFYPVAVGGMMIIPADFAVLLVLLAAVLDFLLRVRTEVRRSEFDWPFLALIGAAGLSILLAHNRGLAVTPTLRIIVIFFAFRVVYKIAMQVGVRRILLFYIYQVSILSLINSVIFFWQGGQQRVFGPAWLPMETFTMTALPMAAAFFLRSRRSLERLRYGFVCTVIAVAIFATQSRAPMVTVAVVLPVLILVFRRRSGETSAVKGVGSVLKLAVPAALVVLLVYFGRETIFQASFERILEMINSTINPEGTIALRVVLWTAAVKAFLTNPLTGIGMGNFKIISQITPEIRLVPVWYYIGGMSPHNVVLHWLAETGLPGAAALLWLAWRGLRAGWSQFESTAAPRDLQTAGALFIGMFIFALSIFYTRAWTWGQDGYIMALLFGLVAARRYGVRESG